MHLVDGYVKIDGASDLNDSSMAAGLCALLSYLKVELSFYIDELGFYQRCQDSQYSFSRDQTICLTAGLYAQGATHLVDIKRVTGHDVFSPSDKGHIERCKGGKASKFQDMYFWAELFFSAKFKPLDELNQLFCKLLVADKKFIKWYCKANPRWQEALRIYWFQGAGYWRNEKAFCEFMIANIENEIALEVPDFVSDRSPSDYKGSLL